MRTSNFLNNVIYAFILQIVTIAGGFLLPRLILKVYGSEINGLLSSIMQFVNLLMLVEGGVYAAAVFALYKPLVTNNQKEINGLLAVANKFYIKVAIAFVFILVLLSVAYPQIIKISSLNNYQVCILVLCLGLSAAIDFLFIAKYRVLLTADQKVYVLSIVNIIHVISNTSLLSLLFMLRADIHLVYVITILLTLFKFVLIQSYMNKNYKYLDLSYSPSNSRIENQWNAFFLQVIGALRVGTPILVATIFTSLKSVSIYTVYNLIFTGISGILATAVSGLSASFGDIIARNDRNKLQATYNEFEFGYYFLLSWLYSCALILIMPFILVYTNGISDTNYHLPYLGVIFVLNGMLLNLKTPQGMLIIAAGLYKETRVQSIVQATIGIIASVIFVQDMGILGVVLGMCISELYRLIDLLVYVPRKITQLSITSSLVRVARVFFVVGISYLPFYWVEIEVLSFMSWIINAIIVGVYSFIITLIINYLFEKEVIRFVAYRVRKLLFNKIFKTES